MSDLIIGFISRKVNIEISPEDIWHLDGHWCLLLFNHPQIADKCDKWDEFSDDEWEDLLKAHPDFIKYKK